MFDKVKTLVDSAQKIVIIQADNPDSDSLGSALALEAILGDMGKEPFLYCGVDMPSYLHHLPGWDRVSYELPPQFDLSIIVDASTTTLLEKLSTSGKQGWVAAKPCVVLDHHKEVIHTIEFASIIINEPGYSSTGELIFDICKQLNWPMSRNAQEFLLNSILGDTQGLTNGLASSRTYRVVAEMIDAGVDRPALEERRREFNKMPEVIYRYKAALIDRTELHNDGRLAVVDISQAEINQYSPLYNPPALIQNDMLQIDSVAVAIVFKVYDDGKVTGAIRCNQNYGIAAKLAVNFGGGGHEYASGFKVTSGRPFNEIKSECIAKTSELLDTLLK